jgi:hypothetical protein
MTARKYLLRAVEGVTFLFAAFGGFLRSVAPPENDNVPFAIGFGSFLTLALLLFISAISRGRSVSKWRARWLVAASVFFLAALASGGFYKVNLDRWTFEYPPDGIDPTRLTAGKVRTPLARPWFEKGLDNSHVLAEFGLENKSRVWTQDSIDHVNILLTVNYLILVLSLASLVFCLTEVVLAGGAGRASPRVAPRKKVLES